MDCYDYDIEDLEEIMQSGVCEGSCPKCGEGYTLEPDGQTVCSCGTVVQSPLLALWLI